MSQPSKISSPLKKITLASSKPSLHDEQQQQEITESGESPFEQYQQHRGYQPTDLQDNYVEPKVDVQMARTKMKPTNGANLGYKVPADTRRNKRKMQASPTNSMKKIDTMKYGQVSTPNLNVLDRNSQMGESQTSLKKGSARGFSPNAHQRDAMSNRSLSPNTKLKKSNISQSETERLFERNHKLASQINIVEELNGQVQVLQEQDHQVEIERLQTTCATLNQKIYLLEDSKREVPLLKQRLQDSQTAKSLLEQENNALKKENYALDEKYKLVQQRQINLEQELEQLKRDYDELDAQKQETTQKMSEQTDYVINMEEKVYKSNKISLELLKQLKDAEIEIDCLKQYIVDLKQRIAVYIPAKDDIVDKKLAEYINNYPEKSKLKLMFLRENPGVYQFGTKKVNLKLEHNGRLKVRVGGGYLSLDEFLDQYTPIELQKMDQSMLGKNVLMPRTGMKMQTMGSSLAFGRKSSGMQVSPSNRFQ